MTLDSRPPSYAAENSFSGRLDGWKEIAGYLRRETRTVQRWEKSEGLPVHRHQHEKGGTVYAYKAELDAWWNQRRQKLEQEPVPDAEVEIAASSEGESKSRPSRPRKYLLGAGMAAVLLVGVVVAQKTCLEITKASNVRLAVLPFVNLSGDAGESFFSDGLTQELIMEVGSIENVEVIAWTTVRALQREGKDARTIGRELDVRYLVEGSVRRDEVSVRITAELVQAETQTHMWAEAFDRESRPENLLAIQGDIARKVAASLKRRLTPTRDDHLTEPRIVAPRAYEAYLRARHFLNLRSQEGFQKAVEYFQQAIILDPTHARAHAGLADTYNAMAFYSLMPPIDAYPRSKSAALRALELDPMLGEAHVSLADVLFSHDFDMAAADREFQRGIELNPSHANAHHWYGLFLVMNGDFVRGRKSLEKAWQLDPLSPIINANIALYHYYARDYDGAIRQCKKILEFSPGFAIAYFWLARAHLERAEVKEALAAFQRAVELEPHSPLFLALQGHAHGKAGERHKSREILAKLDAIAKAHYISPALFGIVHLGLGEKERTIYYAELAYQDRSPILTRIKVEPILDELRSEPRFLKILREMQFLSGPPS